MTRFALPIAFLLFVWAAAIWFSKGTRWFLWLWLPFLLVSLLGAGFGGYCLTLLIGFAGQAGEAAGFAGAGALVGCLVSIPFAIGVIYSIVTRPRSQSRGRPPTR